MIPTFIGKITAPLLVIGTLAMGVLGTYAYGAAQVRMASETAWDNSARERDAHWRAEIEKSNAEVQRAAAEQILAASERAASYRASLDQLKQTITALEAENAALPAAADCGIDANRVRIIRRSGSGRPD